MCNLYKSADDATLNVTSKSLYILILTSSTVAQFAEHQYLIRGRRMHALIAGPLLAALVACTGYLFFLRQQKHFTGKLGPRETSPSRGNPGDKIVLTGFFTPVGKLAGSVSPFTNKIETFLRFAGLPFTTENGGFAGSPKGRVCCLHCALHHATTACQFIGLMSKHM